MAKGMRLWTLENSPDGKRRWFRCDRCNRDVCAKMRFILPNGGRACNACHSSACNVAKGLRPGENKNSRAKVLPT